MPMAHAAWLLICLLVMTACETSSLPNAQCRSNDDCGDNTQCVNQRCRSRLTTDEGEPEPPPPPPLTPCEEGVPCDDGDVCNGVERCDPTSTSSDQSGCVLGTPLVVSDGDACTHNDRCDPATGAMSGTPLPLEDNNACTRDACADGFVVHVPIAADQLDDGIACTVDRCDRDVGATHVADDRQCAFDERCDGQVGCAPLIQAGRWVITGLDAMSSPARVAITNLTDNDRALHVTLVFSDNSRLPVSGDMVVAHSVHSDARCGRSHDPTR
jgi:hypothetical protein